MAVTKRERKRERRTAELQLFHSDTFDKNLAAEVDFHDFRYGKCKTRSS